MCLVFGCSGPLPRDVLTTSRDFGVVIQHCCVSGREFLCKIKPALWELHNHLLFQVCSRVNHKEINFSLEIKLVLLHIWASGFNGEVVTPGFLFGLREKEQMFAKVPWESLSPRCPVTTAGLRRLWGAPWGYIHSGIPAGKSPSCLPCLCPNVSHSGITTFTSYTIITP